MAAAGALAVAAYVGGAWLSGVQSPMARRPILDVSGPPPPYRWVSPPPSLARGNQRPDAGDFSIAFTKGKLEAGVFSTNDQQATVVMSLGAIQPKGSASSVHLTVQPVDPASVGAAPSGFSILGNLYRVQAAYEPGGEPVTRFTKHPLVVLVYPPLVTRGLARTVMFSPDGRTWTLVKTTDDPSTFQASSTVSRLNGYFGVVARGAVASSTPTGAPASGSGGGSALPWIIIGAALVIAAGMGIAELRARAHEREYASYQGASRTWTKRGGDGGGQPGSRSSRRRRPPPKRRRR
ncbi:MAG: hypothetical protein ACJ77A_03640 [Actinomycetota bacterium]